MSFIAMVIIVGLDKNDFKSNSQAVTAHTQVTKSTAIVTVVATKVTNPTAIKQVPVVYPKQLGTCIIPPTSGYTIAHCTNLQMSQQASISRSIDVVIDPSIESQKAKVQAIAREVSSKVCGTVSDCSINIYDNAHAADVDYKLTLLSKSDQDRFIKDNKNSADVEALADDLMAQFSTPDDFTYLFIPTPTPTSTPTPMPTDIYGFPTDAEAVTVAQIAKVPSAYDQQKVTFTCRVAGFAKNDSGDASAINCADPNDIGSIIQVRGSLFDFTQINQDDTVKIYGLGQGAATGKNAFGGDVTEALVDGLYINDLTTGYKN